MSNKNNIYTLYQRQIKDKDTSVNAYMSRALAMCQSMFIWRGLPDSIPQTELERILQTNGSTFVSNINGSLYALCGGKGGELDAYNRPTVYTVSNAALGINRNYSIQEDGVLIDNDTNGTPILPLIGKYAVLMTDAVLSLNTASILSRITMLISASDDKTKQSADAFIEKMLNGDFSVIGENAFFKGVSMQTGTTSNTSYINQIIELTQYIKASLCNELGLNANYNMKRERLNMGETSMNIDILLPYVDNMLKERQRGAAAINEKYGTEITVMLGSSWALERENYITQLTDAQSLHQHPDDDNDGNDGNDGNDDNDKK